MERPFRGLPDEAEWVALREVVPAASAPLRLAGPAAGQGARPVTLATVLPLAWPAWVRPDGAVFLSVQGEPRSGDPGRDLAATLLDALAAEPGPVSPAGPPGPGPRLPDLLEASPLEVTVHDSFRFWLDGWDTAEEPPTEITASLERADTAVVPTRRLAGVTAAYWCRVRDRCHLRWAMPHEEELLLDALARLAAAGQAGVGAGSRLAGSFRVHGLLIPVWDLPVDRDAEAVEGPAVALAGRLADALELTGPLTAAQRRARAELLSRQVTLR